MAKASKLAEKSITLVAKAGWAVFEKLNSISPNASFIPRWSDKPLLKSLSEGKAAPWLAPHDGFPLPRCVPEIRQQIIDGKLPHEILLNEKVGEIKAQIIEARRPDPDGEGLPDPRPLRRRHVDRSADDEAP